MDRGRSSASAKAPTRSAGTVAPFAHRLTVAVETPNDLANSVSVSPRSLILLAMVMRGNLHPMQGGSQHAMQNLPPRDMEELARLLHGGPMHQFLKAWRDHRGLTLEQVAERLPKSPGTISRWEQGQVSPQLSDLMKLGRIYDCDALALLFAPGDPAAATFLRAAHKLLRQMNPEARDQWLRVGIALLPESGDEKPAPEK